MTMTRLQAADPAADLHADPRSPEAQQMLRDTVNIELPRHSVLRRRMHAVSAPRLMRRVTAGRVLVAAAAAVVFAASTSSTDKPTLGAAAYRVSTAQDGRVTVLLRWSQLADPAALQAALDKAGARTKVIVQVIADPSATQLCPAPSNIANGYDAKAVEWHAPGGADDVNALVLRPAYFPTGGTFVLDVALAPTGDTTASTFAPTRPQILGSSSYMVVGRVPAGC